MQKLMVGIACAGLVASAASYAGAVSDASSSAAAPKDSRICESVVGPERGAKPYEMCMSKSEWDAKKIADAKDANRIVCHYEEETGSRFRSAKVCMTAAEWWNARQAERQNVERMQQLSCVPGGGC